MSLRLIVRIDDAGMAANVGGSVLVKHRTFVIEHPEIEAILNRHRDYSHAQVVGVELIPEAALPSPPVKT